MPIHAVAADVFHYSYDARDGDIRAVTMARRAARGVRAIAEEVFAPDRHAVS